MTGAFPWWTVAAGLAGALLLGALRGWLGGPAPRQMAPPRWSIREVAWVVGIAFVALTLRLIGLDERVLDNDEPVGLGVRTLEQWASEDDARLHPPLPPLFMTWFAGGGVDVYAARSVSVLAGVALAVVGFAVVRREAPRAAPLAGLLCATAPALLHSSQLARGYALASALVLVAHWALSVAVTRPTRLAWWSYTLAFVAACSSEYLPVALLLVDAALVFWSVRRDPARRVGLVTSVMGALAMLAAYVPFAWPSWSRGIGGGPHEPSGLLMSPAESLELFGAGGGRVVGLALLGIAGVTAWRRGGTVGRLFAMVAVTLLAVSLGGAVTQMRSRYALVAVAPLLLAACLAIAPWRRFGLLAGALLAVNVVILPGYYSRDTDLVEVNTGAPTIEVLARLRDDPSAPLVVVPSYAIAEPAWRLVRAFPGWDAKRDCPARLCVRVPRRRAVYGLDPRDDFGKLIGDAAHTYVLLRRGTVELPDTCREIMREAGETLYLCTPAPD